MSWILGRSTSWLGLSALLLALAPPASAMKIFLDHNTDGDLTTFQNVAVGLTVPVDIIVLVEPGDGDAEIPFGTVQISWEYQNETGDLYCFDAVGDVNWYVSVPDSPPYVNIFTDTCVCRSCFCVSFFLIAAETEAPPAPGYYKLATLDFSRTGYLCGSSYTYSQASFWLDCFGCGQTNDPRQTMLLLDSATPVQEIVDETWGAVKALYR